MEAHLIHKTQNTCFSTDLPVYFYGLPNGKMVVLFTREKENAYVNKVLEWVMAAHLDFWYNYELGAIMDFKNRHLEFDEFLEFTDKLEQKVNPINTYGSFSNRSNAEEFLNNNISQMLFKSELDRALVHNSCF